MRKSFLPSTRVLPVSALAHALQRKALAGPRYTARPGGVRTVVFDPGLHSVKLDAPAGVRSAAHGPWLPHTCAAAANWPTDPHVGCWPMASGATVRALRQEQVTP